MALNELLKTFNEEKVVEKTEKGFTEKDTGGVSLKGVLQRGRLRLRKEKVPWKQSANFRPSGMTYNYCRRAKVGILAGIFEVYDEVPAPKLQLVFDMGHAIHDIVQGYFWDIGVLKGDYYCLACDKYANDVLAPARCPNCDASRRHLQYKEIQLKDEEHGIRGRTDGILLLDGEEHIMDIKSIANRAAKTSERQFCFEDLEHGPKEDHVVQLNVYMHISGVHRGHLLYVAKNDHMIKSFAIPYDSKVLEPYFQEIKYLQGLATDLLDGKKVELPTPCGQEKCACETIPSKI